MRSKITVDIITPVTTYEYKDVDYLRAPSIEGLFGVLPGHIPSIIALDIGEVKINVNGKNIFFSTSGGFADIQENKVMLILETVEESHEIDIDRAQADLDQSIKMLSEDNIDIKKAQAEIQKAKNRLSIAKKAD